MVIAIGDAVGTFVGLLVGESVGGSVGDWVGSLVGAAVVGLRVGAGVSVGDVGPAEVEGLSEGCNLERGTIGHKLVVQSNSTNKKD